MKPVVWLLSAYRADSHAQWVDWLTGRIQTVDWRVRELPGRHFAWRIRSNPLSWLDDLPEGVPDLILASSMVDLATLKGLHPRLARVPSWYYFHENQLAYPILPGQVESIEPAMVQLYGALAAQRCLFNSRHNRDSFLAGLEALSRRLPEPWPDQLVARLQARSEILPVPVEPIAAGPTRDPGLMLWNHRWEHDKQPDRFTDAVIELADSGLDFRLALLGRRTRRTPPALTRLRERLGSRIEVDGFVDRSAYAHWLGRAGLVVSTALHEFQGISLLEAVSAGARPIVPDALCYPEQYPADCRYDPARNGALTEALARQLAQPKPAPAVDDWLASSTGPRWQEVLGTLLRGLQQGPGTQAQ
ncbi:tRNA-queuosine alpha-mannosyltransferase domain-containing protein [Wenzhouxiangella marina]|uniref:tRNA-queuosine alpha-mannosyltransferase domain-containing protein n=1 Tax=Wenzhouxiangella marina TaxID=1579979 RepID=UPI0006732A3A|nr:DUF3524 domain-containing protein [Wenzhouxiangella marina]MBB6085710.1 glycosyltransferase involved in cell wall biosynthesis [Wenzhouxiangella marina]